MIVKIWNATEHFVRNNSNNNSVKNDADDCNEIRRPVPMSADSMINRGKKIRKDKQMLKIDIYEKCKKANEQKKCDDHLKSCSPYNQLNRHI